MQPKASKSQFKPLPDYERRICRRLAAMRRYLGESQEVFAPRLGLTRAQLANIEAVRVPLRANTAWVACQIFNIHPTWLATGKSPQMPFPVIEDPTMLAILEIFRGGDALFSDQWTEWGPLVLGRNPALEELKRSITLSRPRAKAIAVAGPSGRADEEKSLTNVSGIADTVPVQSTMRKLLERLNRATKPRGKKAELARKLGVPRQCVSDWLSGKREPGGETTLRLLNWVEQEERKPK